jgi:RNA polymerase sigma-70 factor (ECF subfamily)
MNSFDQYTDIEIIQKILKGELALFEILIRRNNPFLYKTGRTYNYSHEDTQDLMQDTFIDAYTHLAKFENRASFKSWLIKRMLNNCYRKQQKAAFKNEVPLEADENPKLMLKNEPNNDTNKTIMNRELSSVIENALQQIPLDYRIVFSLRELNGLDVAETAEALHITEANVKVRLNRGKAMLRKEIEKSYSAEDIFEFNLVYCDIITANVMNKLKSNNK